MTEQSIKNSESLSVSDLASLLSIIVLSFTLSVAMLNKLFSKQFIIEIEGISYIKALDNNIILYALIAITLALPLSWFVNFCIESIGPYSIVINRIKNKAIRLLLFSCIAITIWVLSSSPKTYLLILVILFMMMLHAFKPNKLAVLSCYIFLFTIPITLALGSSFEKKPRTLTPENITFTFPKHIKAPKTIYQLDPEGQLIQTKDEKWIIVTPSSYITLTEK